MCMMFIVPAVLAQVLYAIVWRSGLRAAPLDSHVAIWTEDSLVSYLWFQLSSTMHAVLWFVIGLEMPPPFPLLTMELA
jgi:hypothetical protein